jgi:16S rRNA (uracil1498-N3)-methyltransferase
MTIRLHVPIPLQAGSELNLPPGPARHAQVRRLQPGDDLHLFNGDGGHWAATVLRMGRSEVSVRVVAFDGTERELPVEVTLAVGMPANERMDMLVEKATELGVSAVQPLVCARSVLRLSGERAQRKREHWQAIAVAACEQCGRNRVPRIEPVQPYAAWLATAGAGAGTAGVPAVRRLLLSLAPGTSTLPRAANGATRVLLLSGPEGGLDAAEEALAGTCGFDAVHLGPRVLRADTAPLAALAWLGVGLGSGPDNR